MSTPASASPEQGRGQRFLEMDEHTILDVRKRLVWMKQDTWQMTGKWLNWVQARDMATELNASRFGGYVGWRMPTVEEARTLFDKTQSNKDYQGQTVPFQAVFPGGFSFLCWTKDVRNKIQAIRFSFRKGSIMYDDIYRTSRGATRFVREIEK